MKIAVAADERTGVADAVVDAGGHRDHFTQPWTRLRPGEVGADPAVEIDGGADVEHFVRRSAEHVDTRSPGQVRGERALGPLFAGDGRDVVPELGETVDAEIADALDERVQDVHGGAGVVERAVCRLRRDAEELGECREFHRGCLVAAEDATRQFDCADHGETRPRRAAVGSRGLEETDVESGVVGDEYRTRGELEKRRQHLVDLRCGVHHRGGDAGELHDVRWDRTPRVHQRRELAEPLAGTHLDRADLGDAAAVRSAAGGLQVEHHEGGVRQGHRRRVDRPVGGQQRVQSALHVGRLCHGREL